MTDQTKKALDEFRVKLWHQIQAEEAKRLPFPGELSDSEKQSLMLMRLSAHHGEEVAESELIDLFVRAEEAKADWGFYRAAMAGILNLSIEDGQLMVAVTEAFVEQNPQLLKKAKEIMKQDKNKRREK